MPEVRKLADQHEALLIFDEVQSGCGRTGDWFAYQGFDVEPDVMTLAKAVCGGLAGAAMLTTADLGDHLSLGIHGTTYGGSPLMCATALAVCETLERQHLIDHVVEVGAYFRGRLQTLCDRFDRALEVRGRGLMLGLGLTHGAADLYRFLLQNGVIANAVGDKTLRILPPFIITREEIDVVVETMQSWFTRQA